MTLFNMKTSSSPSLVLLQVFVCGFMVGVILAAIPALLTNYSRRAQQDRVLSYLLRGNYSFSSETAGMMADTDPLGGERGPREEEPSVDFSQRTQDFLQNWSNKDDKKTADDLSNRVRILCWVMTGPHNLERRAIHVQRTWGQRCNILLFASDYENKTFPTINITVPGGHENLMAKTTAAFEYAYKHHYNDADWFLKADDDTYVIVENLRHLVSKYDTMKPLYFGHHYHMGVANIDYASGGGGYIVSKEALTRFHNRDTYEPKVDKFGRHCNDDQGAEDAEFGKCMTILGVTLGDSRDVMGRTRFHCFVPDAFLLENYAQWYYTLDGNGAAAGIDSMSDYAVTFHYLNPEVDMYKLDFLIYKLKVYGVVSGLQDINGPAKKNYTNVPIKDRINIKDQVLNVTQTCKKSTHYTLDVYTC